MAQTDQRTHAAAALLLVQRAVGELYQNKPDLAAARATLEHAAAELRALLEQCTPEDVADTTVGGG